MQKTTNMFTVQYAIGKKKTEEREEAFLHFPDIEPINKESFVLVKTEVDCRVQVFKYSNLASPILIKNGDGRTKAAMSSQDSTTELFTTAGKTKHVYFPRKEIESSDFLVMALFPTTECHMLPAFKVFGVLNGGGGSNISAVAERYTTFQDFPSAMKLNFGYFERVPSLSSAKSGSTCCKRKRDKDVLSTRSKRSKHANLPAFTSDFDDSLVLLGGLVLEENSARLVAEPPQQNAPDSPFSIIEGFESAEDLMCHNPVEDHDWLATLLEEAADEKLSPAEARALDERTFEDGSLFALHNPSEYALSDMSLILEDEEQILFPLFQDNISSSS